MSEEPKFYVWPIILITIIYCLIFLMAGCEKRPNVVLYGNNGSCKGVIVAKGEVLTANHCKGVADLVLYRGGERKVKAWSQIGNLDLAIAGFISQWDENIPQICEPKNGKAMMNGKEVTITGILTYSFYVDGKATFGESGSGIYQDGCLVGILTSRIGVLIAHRADLYAP